MQLKIKILNKDLPTPAYANIGDAGLDLYASQISEDEFENLCYKTGISTEFPEDYVGFLFPRSSITKYDLTLANSVGVLDSGFRGEIVVKFKKRGDNIYKVGDKIAQLVFLEKPKVQIEITSELSESGRGLGGFGSTGK